MSEYIHEIVLQEFICENIRDLNILVNFGKESYALIDAKFNKKNFWDLDGKLDDGSWIPLEIEWESKRFITHGHLSNPEILKFRKRGVLLVLRKSQEIEGIQQISIFDNTNETQIKNEFKRWFLNKSPVFFDSTLSEFLVGNYPRKVPRIILHSFGKKARANYLQDGDLYRPNNKSPALMGFNEQAYKNSLFIQDINPGDVILFLNCGGITRGDTIEDFKNKIKGKKIKISYLYAYKINSKLWDAREKNLFKTTKFWWPEEIKKDELIYFHRCKCEEKPFIRFREVPFPYIKEFTDDLWSKVYRCLYDSQRHELSPMFFTLLISNLK